MPQGIPEAYGAGMALCPRVHTPLSTQMPQPHLFYTDTRPGDGQLAKGHVTDMPATALGTYTWACTAHVGMDAGSWGSKQQATPQAGRFF